MPIKSKMAKTTVMAARNVPKNLSRASSSKAMAVFTDTINNPKMLMLNNDPRLPVSVTPDSSL